MTRRRVARVARASTERDRALNDARGRPRVVVVSTTTTTDGTAADGKRTRTMRRHRTANARETRADRGAVVMLVDASPSMFGETRRERTTGVFGGRGVF